jgi:hypothetical protein
LTTSDVLCRKSTDLSWEGDEPSAAVAKEDSMPAVKESAPLPRAETVTQAVEATLPEASIAEGKYTAQMQPSSRSSRNPWETNPVCLLLTGAEVEGSTIPEAVPIEGVMPETQEAAGAATDLAEIAGGEAPEVAEEVCDDVLPESSLEVVVRSPEIQDAEPICSAPMSKAATSSRWWNRASGGRSCRPSSISSQLGGDAAGRAMDEGKLSVPLNSRSAMSAEYPSNKCCLLQDVVERS